ncbi:innexin inx2-like isoform X2 [Stegodyphus dumicola]|uniref:innexin inx2-like isoform X2 n=1 Tax=Stegodyphus dumicola TaxID=202533 RepID=UPI0015AA4E9F|nr:innexin inx2-like isoform X2 [Stegodyphus dumicola]
MSAPINAFESLKDTSRARESFKENHLTTAKLMQGLNGIASILPSKLVGIESPHPGIRASENESEYVYRNYYQYVHLVLFIQGLLFYLPHLIWKSIDRDHMDSFYIVISSCKEQSKHKPSSSSLEKEKPGDGDSDPFDAAASYIEERWGTHTTYIFKYLFCELMAVINIMIQFYLLDVFFQGEFLSLGSLISSHYKAERLKDPIRLFPLVTNCYFRRIGASGRIDTVDAYCVLPINALNVKIFLFLWIWFPVILILSFGSLINFFFAFCIPKYRLLSLKLKSILFRSHVDTKSYMKLITTGNFGDWFILSCIKCNMDELNFSRLMENLNTKINTLEIIIKEP